MHRLLGPFVVGVAVGATTVIVLRHELSLTSQAATVTAVGGLGAALAAILWGWSRAISKREEARDEGGPRPPVEGTWTAFVWASLALLVIYTALLAIVLFG